MVGETLFITQDYRLSRTRVAAPLGGAVFLYPALDVDGDAGVERMIVAFDDVDVPGAFENGGGEI